MSWFDDPDLEAAFDGIGLEAFESGLRTVYDEPVVGGEISNRYRIEKVISPGRCVVYHPGTDKHFTARLSSDLLPGTPQFERLNEVMDAAGLVSNDGLGFVVEFGVCPIFGGFAICERFEGSTFREVARSAGQSPFSLEDALSFVVDVGGMLADLHEIGVSHGLLDANDLARDRTGRWRLMPAGLPAETVTLAPPGVKLQVESTEKSDQWALAFMVYGLMVGRSAGTSPRPPSQLRQNLPPALDDVLLRALSVSEAARWPTTRAFVDAFQTAVIESNTQVSEALNSDVLLMVHPDGAVAATPAKPKVEARAIELQPHDRLSLVKALDQHAQVNAAEAFLLSRISGTTEVSHLRSFFNGLPFDFDQTLIGLIEREFIRVTKATSVTTPHRPVTKPAIPVAREVTSAYTQAPRTVDKPRTVEKPKVEVPRDEIDVILDKASVFESRGNFRAAIEICHNALSTKMDGRLLHRLAVLRARFQGAYGKASRELERAHALRPDDTTIEDSRRWLQALIETEGIQKIWRYELPAGRYRMLRLDPDLRRLWVEIDASSPPERRVVAVDYQRGRVVSTVRSHDPRNESAIAGNHFRLAVHEAKLPSKNVTTRLRREKLVEMVKNSDDFGPWFRVGPSPIAYSPNSSFLVFDRHPETGEEGLYITHEGMTMAPLRLERDGLRGVRPVIAPDSTGAVAYTTVGPIQAAWVSELYQASRQVHTVQGESSVLWSTDAQFVYVLEHRSGRIDAVGRRGGEPRTVAELDVSRAWYADPDNTLAVVVASNDKELSLVSFQTGLKGRIKLPEKIERVLVRSDGIAVAQGRSGLWFIDFAAKRAESINVAVHPSSFDDNQWLPRQPLVFIRSTPDAVEVGAIDPAVVL
ncbi:MAG: hypothetical protein R3E66_17140 [bacterium]